MFKQLFLPEIRKLIKDRDLVGLKEFLKEAYPSDIAEILEEMPEHEALILFRLLPQEKAADVFAELEPAKQESLLRQFTSQEIKELVLELDPDERTKLFEELPGQLTQKLLDTLPPKQRKKALEILAYPENSVGRLITPNYVSVLPHWTVGEAIEHIRREGKKAQTVDMIYVVDEKGQLLDDIPIKSFIFADPEEKVDSLMDRHFVSIMASEDQEEAVKLVKKYNLVALPVTDSRGVLIGIVTIDDILDVSEEENTEDFQKIAAVTPETGGVGFITNLLEVSLSKLYKMRITWLVVLLFVNIITGGIIGFFEETIVKYVVLVTFLPVLIDTGGNAGAQSATLMVRAIALGNVKLNDWIKLLGKEFLISGALGFTMALGVSVIGIVRGGLKIALVVSTAMLLNVVIGSTIGMSLPFIFTKLKKDPATASTPLVTTICDIAGTGIYFLIAALFLM
ncbi:magnesium transporter [Candidatus Aerophobetes bacterium]|nr:magnesium transporter [Candidatus Aerophobetes bacterium]